MNYSFIILLFKFLLITSRLNEKPNEHLLTDNSSEFYSIQALESSSSNQDSIILNLINSPKDLPTPSYVGNILFGLIDYQLIEYIKYLMYENTDDLYIEDTNDDLTGEEISVRYIDMSYEDEFYIQSNSIAGLHFSNKTECCSLLLVDTGYQYCRYIFQYKAIDKEESEYSIFVYCDEEAEINSTHIMEFIEYDFDTFEILNIFNRKYTISPLTP
jgi:hypothetical protein